MSIGSYAYKFNQKKVKGYDINLKGERSYP